jgi:hypothetical protein
MRQGFTERGSVLPAGGFASLFLEKSSYRTQTGIFRFKPCFFALISS